MNHKVDAASSDDMIFCLIKMQKNKKSAMPQNPKHSGRYVHNKKTPGRQLGLVVNLSPAKHTKKYRGYYYMCY